MTTDAAQLADTAVLRADLDLVRATREGDLSAFDQLVSRYDRKLFRIAQNITHNREDSEDAVQECFLKVFQNLNGFREQAQFSTWIYRIVVNVCLMKFRKRSRFKEIALEDDSQNAAGGVSLEPADWAPNPEELFHITELRNILTKGLQCLSPAFRAAFVLRDIEGLSITDTAEVIGVSSAAVKARLFRARARLRLFISSHFVRPRKPGRGSDLSFSEVNQLIMRSLSPTQRVDHQGAL